MSPLQTVLLRSHDRVATIEAWVTPLVAVLEGVTDDEACWKPTPDAHSLGEIVAHQHAWCVWLTRFLDGDDTDVTDWPTPSDWATRHSELEAALIRLREQLEALTDDQLAEAPTPTVTPTTRLEGIMSILIHNAYHVGQLTQLRQRYAESRIQSGRG